MAAHQAPASSGAGPRRRPRVLLAASGSVAAIKFEALCRSVAEWADVRAVATASALHFIDEASFPDGVPLYTDDDEWSRWRRVGDEVLHIELRRWADALVIAPLSANTLAKVAGGLCDNLLTCVVRAWDYSKPVYVAPAMNTFMWDNPFTARHLAVLRDLGMSIVQPVTKRLACGDYGNGAMAEPSEICKTLVLFFGPQHL
ncbi:hypothetical protein BDA96_03G033100 [Sorghum bicolor]|uniref:phosphopantothenoylcysteine decarboxylase n=2 Tax=Sorghum bicolor TaxID=4558 RepID=A0A921RA56_SORBI|nr:phosphopantothenoylcysteine decarboxylase [Sorghum bicolor]EES02299.1 hypothetical protein SORBI_3003G030200 [Sorghum bicolor]KAG0536072.1 hypothetical protein BDA96_03G033100 [Sorghum bicolor]|eukprot:XP_002457179.1 phosphopantothenoylcysteine decarboxylase [Sorghum bicolor]